MDHTRDELKKKREQYRTKMFRIMLELVFIFGIPAIIGLFAYKALTERAVSIFVSLLPLAVAFILSWIITVYRVKQVSGKLQEVDQQLQNTHES